MKELTLNKEKVTTTATFSDNDHIVCSVCNGTGWAVKLVDMSDVYGQKENGEPFMIEHAVKCPECNGGIKQNAEHARERANIPHSFYNSDLSSFDWNVYRDPEGRPIDLSKQKKFIDSFVKDFQKWEEHGLGLYVFSHMKGSGKTFLASCICNELIREYAIRTRFVSAADLLNIARNANKNSSDRWENDPIGVLGECRLLVIDDVGQSETGGKWLEDILFRIMDKRMVTGRVTILTSNIKPAELRIDDRIADRINRTTQLIPLPDYCVRAKEATAVKTAFFKDMGLI